MHPLVTRVKVVADLVAHQILLKLLMELPEGHGYFRLPCVLQMPLRTLQLPVVISENIQIPCMQHKLVTILKTVALTISVLGEMVDSVNFVFHTKVQIPSIIYFHVPHHLFSPVPLSHMKFYYEKWFVVLTSWIL